MAHYKTIALEMIHDQPELYERLRSSKRLLPAMDAYAIDLKGRHEHWKAQLGRRHPGSDPRQVAAEALELAIEDLRRRLRSASTASDEEPLSLDAAINHARRHTPPA